jgi:hypothetical protein
LHKKLSVLPLQQEKQRASNIFAQYRHDNKNTLATLEEPFEAFGTHGN